MSNHQPADPPQPVVFANRMVRLLAVPGGPLVVEHADGYRRELDPEESDYVRAVGAAAIECGVPEKAYASAAGEYLFQVCLGARRKDTEVWRLVFRTVPAGRMGEIIAEDYLQTRGVRN